MSIQTAQTRQIVIFDPRVDDLHLLLNGLQPGIEAYILNPETDGIAQISRILTRRPADSLTLVAHGSPGGLQLGAGTLELGNLHRYTEQLQTWFDDQSGKDGAVETAATDTKPTGVGLSSQSAQADLAPVAAISHRQGLKLKPQLTLLACQVAATDAGAEFIEQLQTLTGAQIAASRQPQGNGNWLPTATATFTAATLKAYSATLPWENVGSAGFSAGGANDTDLEFNGNTPYVVYQDWGNSGKATVKMYDGTSWVDVGSPGFSGGVAYFTDLEFDGSTPYVVYRDTGNSYKATVKMYDGTSWVDVGSPGFSAGQTSYTDLEFNGSTPYVVYRDDSNSYKATVMRFVVPSPEIDIQGNSTSIPDGDTTPATTDHTDFGSLNTANGTLTHTFTIQNTANGTLTLSNPTLSGTNAGDFTLTNPATLSILPNTSTTFTVTFDPSASGTRTATLTLANNDSDENPYNFTLSGTGVTPQLSIANATAQLEGTSHTFTVTRNSGIGASSATYTVSGNGATPANATDFGGTFPTGTVSFADTETSKTITIPVTQDPTAEPNEGFQVTLSSPAGATLGTSVGTSSITNNDTAGFTLSKTTASVSETGTTDTFTVVLNAQPTSNVVLNITSSDTTEATVTTPLTFTNANWNVPQTVTVTGVDDNLVDGNQTSTITLAVNDGSSDDAFDGVADQTVTVTTTDDDVAGITLDPVANPSVNEEGATTDTYTVKLDTEPTASVTVTIASDNQTGISPTPLTFTPGNWNTPQTVTVTAVDDTVAEGNHTSTLTHSSSHTHSHTHTHSQSHSHSRTHSPSGFRCHPRKQLP